MASCVLLLLLLVLVVCKLVHCGVHQRQLLDKLFGKDSDYETLELPVENDHEPLNVKVHFTLSQIVSLDEKDQYLQLLLWFNVHWHDYRLMWNRSEYKNITVIRVLPSAVWKPDILTFNSADENFDRMHAVNVLVKYNGEMQWVPPSMIKSSCTIRVRWFPFDEQSCILIFGSWTYDKTQVNLTLPEEDAISMDSDVNRTNVEWELLDHHAKVCEVTSKNKQTIRLMFHFKRMSLYYYWNLMIPTGLIAVCGLMVFALPADCTEKMQLSVTTLLSLTVFMMVVAENLPRTSQDIPLLGIYFGGTLFLCSLAIACSIWVLSLYFLNDAHEPPDWVVNGLCCQVGRYLRMEIPDQVFVVAQKKLAAERPEAQLLQAGRAFMAPAAKESMPPCSRNTPACLLHKELDKILKNLKTVSRKASTEEDQECIAETWRFAGRVIDRLCLIVFSVAHTVCACVILFPPDSEIAESDICNRRL